MHPGSWALDPTSCRSTSVAGRPPDTSEKSSYGSFNALTGLDMSISNDILGSRNYAQAAPDKELWAPGKRPRFLFDQQINKQLSSVNF